MEQEYLIHHGVKGQKWGIRNDRKQLNSVKKEINSEYKKTDVEKREHIIGTSAGALIGTGIGLLTSYIKYFSKGADYKQVLAKTALRTVGMTIVGGLLGHTITTAKQIYTRDSKLTSDKNAYEIDRAGQ